MANSILGDVNGDGKITIEDMLLVWVEAQSPATIDILTPEQVQRADINGDGVVNIQDMIKIRNHITGDNILRGLL